MEPATPRPIEIVNILKFLDKLEKELIEKVLASNSMDSINYNRGGIATIRALIDRILDKPNEDAFC